MKFHGIGSATGPSGVLVYHKPSSAPVMALLLETSVASHFFDIRNNLFVARHAVGTRVADCWGRSTTAFRPRWLVPRRRLPFQPGAGAWSALPTSRRFRLAASRRAVSS